MPLRKQGTIIPATAAIMIALAALPPAAGAAFWSPVSKPASTPVATSPAPSTPPASTPPASTPPPAVPVAEPGGCVTPPTTAAFSRFKDAASYYLSPGGGFEAGSEGWRLTSGAKIVSGNENLGISAGSKALELPLGGTATSPAFCVDEVQPSFRFTSKLSSLDGGYAAIVIYRDTDGKLTQTQFTSSAAGTYFNGATNWAPSTISPLATRIPFLAGGNTASVQLMFVGTTKSYGQWVGAKAYIDSVMVDPYRRG